MAWNIAIKVVSGKTPTYLCGYKDGITYYYSLTSTTYFTKLASSTTISNYSGYYDVYRFSSTLESNTTIIQLMTGGGMWVCDRTNSVSQTSRSEYVNVKLSPFTTYTWYGGSGTVSTYQSVQTYVMTNTQSYTSIYNIWNAISNTPEIVGPCNYGQYINPTAYTSLAVNGSGALGMTSGAGSTGTVIYQYGYKPNGYTGGNITFGLVTSASGTTYLRLSNARGFPYDVFAIPPYRSLTCNTTGNTGVFSYHNINASSSINVWPRVSGTTTSNLVTNTPRIEIARSAFAAFNEWATAESKDGTKKYFAITSRSINQFVMTSMTVNAGYQYLYNLGTFSQAGADGIIISSTTLTSSSSVSSAGFARCSGTHQTSSYTYTPSSNGTVYIYFKTDADSILGQTGSYNESTHQYNSSGYTYGNVLVTKSPRTYTCTFNANGGTLGTSSTTVTYDTLSAIVVTPPTRSGYTFLGYYDTSSISGGNRYFDSDGEMCKAWDKTSNATLYARWENTVTLPSNFVSTLSIYCTSSAVAASTAQGTRTGYFFPDDEPYCASGGNLTYGISNITGYLIPPAWVTGDGDGIAIPSGTGAFSGLNRIIFYSPSGTNYVSSSAAVTLSLALISTNVSYYGTPTGTATQTTNFPASAITLTSTNILNYYTITKSQTLTYNNGSSRSGTVTTSVAIGPTVTLTTLGSTVATASVISFPSAFVINLSGEGGKSSSFNITSGTRAANALLSVSISSAASVSYDATIAVSVKATFTSGEYDVTDAVTINSSGDNGIYSGNTSIVSFI